MSNLQQPRGFDISSEDFIVTSRCYSPQLRRVPFSENGCTKSKCSASGARHGREHARSRASAPELPAAVPFGAPAASLHLRALRLLPTSLAITDGRRFRTPTRLSVTVRTTIVLPTADSCFAGCGKLNSDPTLGLCVPAPPAGVHSLTCSSSEANPPCKVRNNGPSKNELANSLPILALTGAAPPRPPQM